MEPIWKKLFRTKLWMTALGVGLIAFAGPLGIPVAAIPYIAGLTGGYVAAEGAADIRSRGAAQPKKEG